MGLADYDHAGADELLGKGGSAGAAAVAPCGAAPGSHSAFELDQILERDGDAVQRPDGVARPDGLIGRLCGQASFGLVNLDEGVQLWVQVGNALEATADDLDRRNAARFEPGCQSMKASLSVVCAHRWTPKVSLFSRPSSSRPRTFTAPGKSSRRCHSATPAL